MIFDIDWELAAVVFSFGVALLLGYIGGYIARSKEEHDK